MLETLEITELVTSAKADGFLIHQSRPQPQATERISEQNHSKPNTHLANQIYNIEKV